MKTLMFVRKTLLEIWRSPQLFWLYLLFPSMMVLMYYSAFGQTSGMSNYLTVLVDNQDQGEYGAGMVQAIRDAEFDGKAAFTVMEGFSHRQAEIMLNEGKAAMLITLPEQFSAALLNNLPQPVQIEMLGDPLNDTYAFAQSFLGEILQVYSDQSTGWQQELPVSLEFLPNTGTLNDFQIGVPGLIIFGILFGVITNALLLTRERSDGTIKRIQLSQASAAHFLGGITLAGLLLSLVQMLVTFAVAAAVGFKPVGSLWLCVGIGLIASLGAAGAGFLAAVFSKNEGEATGYGTALMVPLVFLSGAIFPMPYAEWFRIFGQTVQPYDFMPSTHAARAMSKVILYGQGVSSIGYELIMMVLLSGVLLAAGIWLYQHRVLSKSL
jgi:ABC-2 type transport system permease protein